jgi:hypothetical protein
LLGSLLYGYRNEGYGVFIFIVASDE